MDLEMRAVTEDELPHFLTAAGRAFGQLDWRDDDEFPAHLLTADRTLAMFDDRAIVANAAAFSFHLTVPGGNQVEVAAVTMVGVQPTHRRRGLLRQLMDAQLDDAAERGEPVAVLTASEASIYERFGYGVGTFSTRWELASEHARLQTPPEPKGRVRLVDGDAAVDATMTVYDVAASHRVGEIARPRAWWERIFRAGSGDGPHAPKFFTAVHDAPDGRPDAFARYTIEAKWPDGVPANVLRVLELHAIDAEAEAAVWEYLFGVDLVGTIEAGDRAMDEPLRWRLPDPRRLRAGRVRDHLWVRVLDVAAAMAARTYAVDDALVVELVDGFRPANSGRWRIDGGPDVATCTPTDAGADIVLGAPDLGALYLGGVSASTLAAAGRVGERVTGAVARADRFFGVQPLPWCTTHF
jgi:predicted acetyltransferase